MVKTNAKSRARWLAEQLEIAPQIQLADIGARMMKGDPFYSALLDFGLVQMHGFEPEPIAFEALKAAAGPNMTVYPTAVGKPGPATFYAHHIGSLSSVFKIKAAAAYFLGKSFWVQRPITEHDMTLVALDEIADFPDLDILKMDTQGAELDILQGARRT
ncbi:MAG: FkbM family methyltransferase, partial [Octadecabacter sp.]